MVKIKQFRYPADTTVQWRDNVFSDLDGEVTQLGIQAPSGTKFYLNGFNTEDNALQVGCTGIYELDLEGLTTLTQLRFNSNSLANAETIIVDVIYRTMDGV